MSPRTVLLTGLLALGGCISVQVPSSVTEAARVLGVGIGADSSAAAAPAASGVRGSTREEVCADSPVPEGWAVVSDYWAPGRCGQTQNMYPNVWRIEDLSERAVGSRVEVCDFSPVPRGWVVERSRWSPSTCGKPASMEHKNVQSIKRLR